MTLSEIDEALTEANRVAHDPRQKVEDRKAARVLVDHLLDQRLVAVTGMTPEEWNQYQAARIPA